MSSPHEFALEQIHKHIWLQDNVSVAEDKLREHNQRILLLLDEGAKNLIKEIFPELADVRMIGLGKKTIRTHEGYKISNASAEVPIDLIIWYDNSSVAKFSQTPPQLNIDFRVENQNWDLRIVVCSSVTLLLEKSQTS